MVPIQRVSSFVTSYFASPQFYGQSALQMILSPETGHIIDDHVPASTKRNDIPPGIKWMPAKEDEKSIRDTVDAPWWHPAEEGESLHVRRLQDGWTALHEAAWRGEKGKVDRLLREGADRTAEDTEGRTAWKIAKDRARYFHLKGRWKESQNYAEIAAMIMYTKRPEEEPSPTAQRGYYRVTKIWPASETGKANRPTKAELEQKFIEALSIGDYETLSELLNDGVSPLMMYEGRKAADWAKETANQVPAPEANFLPGCGHYVDCARLLLVAEYIQRNLADNPERLHSRTGAMAEVILYQVGKENCQSFESIRKNLPAEVRDNLGLLP